VALNGDPDLLSRTVWAVLFGVFVNGSSQHATCVASATLREPFARGAVDTRWRMSMAKLHYVRTPRPRIPHAPMGPFSPRPDDGGQKNCVYLSASDDRRRPASGGIACWPATRPGRVLVTNRSGRTSRRSRTRRAGHGRHSGSVSERSRKGRRPRANHRCSSCVRRARVHLGRGPVTQARPFRTRPYRLVRGDVTDGVVVRHTDGCSLPCPHGRPVIRFRDTTQISPFFCSPAEGVAVT
jgi:hypothetical protein